MTAREQALEKALYALAAHTLDNTTNPPTLFCWCNPGRTAHGHSAACLEARAALALPVETTEPAEPLCHVRWVVNASGFGGRWATCAAGRVGSRAVYDERDLASVAKAVRP